MKHSKKEEARLLIATFIVATLIPLMQVDYDKLEQGFASILGIITYPLIFSALFAFFFIVTKGLELSYILEGSRLRILQFIKMFLYDFAIGIYLAVMGIMVLLYGYVKLFHHAQGAPLPTWPFWLSLTIVFGVLFGKILLDAVKLGTRLLLNKHRSQH